MIFLIAWRLIVSGLFGNDIAGRIAARIVQDEEDDDGLGELFSMSIRVPETVRASMDVMARHMGVSRNTVAIDLLRAGIQDVADRLPQEDHRQPGAPLLRGDRIEGLAVPESNHGLPVADLAGRARGVHESSTAWRDRDGIELDRLCDSSRTRANDGGVADSGDGQAQLQAAVWLCLARYNRPTF